MKQKTVPVRFVPLDKQSKKQRRAYYAARRGGWGPLNPVTRVVPDRREYDRRQAKKTCRDWQ